MEHCEKTKQFSLIPWRKDISLFCFKLSLLPDWPFFTIFVCNKHCTAFSFNQVIAKDMKMTYHMEGKVNGHEFTIDGDGTGNPYE